MKIFVTRLKCQQKDKKKSKQTMYVLYDDLKCMVPEKHVREYLNVVTFKILALMQMLKIENF